MSEAVELHGGPADGLRVAVSGGTPELLWFHVRSRRFGPPPVPPEFGAGFAVYAADAGRLRYVCRARVKAGGVL